MAIKHSKSSKVSPLRLIDCGKERREKAQERTAAVFRALARMAERGEVAGAAICYRSAEGEFYVTSGAFEGDAAIGALVRMEMQLAQEQDEE